MSGWSQNADYRGQMSFVEVPQVSSFVYTHMTGITQPNVIRHIHGFLDSSQRFLGYGVVAMPETLL
jgi:hypothetical protein